MPRAVDKYTMKIDYDPRVNTSIYMHDIPAPTVKGAMQDAAKKALDDTAKALEATTGQTAARFLALEQYISSGGINTEIQKAVESFQDGISKFFQPIDDFLKDLYPEGGTMDRLTTSIIDALNKILGLQDNMDRLSGRISDIENQLNNGSGQ